ncbi:AraC family transcriptional regulator [Chitinophaga silvatica]|uniref:AraC family transcriptional regulator n=1 Tax=Chitinophaga silvatica TaxID=2282649 RepID=A0A3E1Y715_9BACT|nr:helix-turn-helix transcriptional regulator [Chitinophaga silvatica]RFS20720.1 AraC family transcriptional regulator [Chitinophaga silvatica]
MKPSTLIHWKSQIELAIAITHDDPYGSLNLKKVAALLNEAEDNFGHKFSLFQGESFTTYNRRRRVEAAAGELRHSGYTITDIADRWGYTKASFTRAFRDLYNETPSSFRDKKYIWNEEHTLYRTQIITSPHQHYLNSMIFNPDNTIDIQLPHSVLYYNILPGEGDPIKELMHYYKMYQQQHQGIKDTLMLDGTKVILGTLDVVPVTPYHKMKMYIGIMVPKLYLYDATHIQIQRSFQDHFRLHTKHMTGGHFKKMKVPMSYSQAGLPMYQFINNSCREGIFKMSSNHFFMSAFTENSCEVYIPWLKYY